MDNDFDNEKLWWKRQSKPGWSLLLWIHAMCWYLYSFIEEHVSIRWQHLVKTGFAYWVIRDPKPLWAERWRTTRWGRAAAIRNEMSWMHVPMVNQYWCELEKVLWWAELTREAQLWSHTSRLEKNWWTVPIWKRVVIVMMLRFCAISSGPCHCAIIWINRFYGFWWAFDWDNPLCGSTVFVAVHRQVLGKLHMLLPLDGTAFNWPCQSL